MNSEELSENPTVLGMCFGIPAYFGNVIFYSKTINFPKFQSLSSGKKTYIYFLSVFFFLSHTQGLSVFTPGSALWWCSSLLMVLRELTMVLKIRYRSAACKEGTSSTVPSMPILALLKCYLLNESACALHDNFLNFLSMIASSHSLARSLH